MKTHTFLGVAIVWLVSSTAALGAAITVTVGDNYGYGFGVADNGVAIWPGPGLSGENYDGRSAAEAAATDGSEFTDSYSTMDPGFGPHLVDTGSFFFPYAGTLTSGSLTVDMGDFQSSSFGEVLVSFNGVAQPGLFDFDDGFQSTAVRTFVLSPAAIANANAAGQLVVTVDRNGSVDFIAFDFLELNGETGVAAVPEPASLAIWSVVGVAGLVLRRRRRSLTRVG
jgi:hypothetical protein